MSDVAIVDSGGANIASLRFALQRLGVTPIVTSDAEAIAGSSHVILPGVGSAQDAMGRLADRELDELLPTLTQPVLGICLGMQLLFDASDEGPVDCLRVIPGKATLMPSSFGFPVPHMGWNQLTRLGDDEVLDGIPDGAFAYFVHSYALPLSDATIAETSYRSAFASVVRQRNFVGTQFHPERSSEVGSRLLQNFLAMAP